MVDNCNGKTTFMMLRFSLPDGTTLRIPQNYNKILNDFRKL